MKWKTKTKYTQKIKTTTKEMSPKINNLDLVKGEIYNK